MKHEEFRKQIWIKAWCSVANAVNCLNSTSASQWADDALASFDARFPAPEPEPTKELCVDYTPLIFCSLISSEFYASTIDSSNCVRIIEQANEFSQILNNKLKQMK